MKRAPHDDALSRQQCVSRYLESLLKRNAIPRTNNNNNNNAKLALRQKSILYVVDALGNIFVTVGQPSGFEHAVFIIIQKVGCGLWRLAISF